MKLAIADEIAVPGTIRAAFDSYFKTSELDYYSSSGAVQSERHAASFNKWKEEVAIDTFGADIQYTITNVLENTDTTAKIEVYEWTTVRYQIRGVEEILTMGFGTNHIVHLQKDGSVYMVGTDSYSEINGYEVGYEEDLAVLRQHSDDFLRVGEGYVPTADASIRVANSSYNHSAAGAGNPMFWLQADVRILFSK